MKNREEFDEFDSFLLIGNATKEALAKKGVREYGVVIVDEPGIVVSERESELWRNAALGQRGSNQSVFFTDGNTETLSRTDANGGVWRGGRTEKEVRVKNFTFIQMLASHSNGRECSIGAGTLYVAAGAAEEDLDRAAWAWALAEKGGDLYRAPHEDE